MASLVSAWSKWERAKAHSETLNGELAGSIPSVPWAYDYPMTHEIQPDGLEYRFYVDPPPFDATRSALIAGDCLFNLRAALDHVVYALHERRFRGNIPAALIERTQFPIRDTPRRDSNGRPLPTERWPEIRWLSIRQRRAIKFLQPYNRRNDKFSRIRELLSELATLNNIDKHRYLHVVRAVGVGIGVPHWSLMPMDPYGFRQRSFFFPLEGKTEVARWNFDVIPPDIARQIEIHSTISAGIALHEGGEQMMLLPHVDAWIDAVETVLRRFETFFR